MTNFFQRKDLDGWDVRRGLQELFSIDGVPDPVTISAALHACRRVNDHSLAVRFMETLRYKCGGKVREIYPYLIQEVRPTLDQLGISTPEGTISPINRKDYLISSTVKFDPGTWYFRVKTST